MSFFIRNKKTTLGKRKKIDKQNNKIAKNDVPDLQEEISSDSDEEGESKKKVNDYDDKGSDNEFETAQEKKIRLAKKYLQQIEIEEKEKLDQDEIDKSVISRRLRNEVLEEAGKFKRKIADNYISTEEQQIRILKNAHKLSVTCVVISPDNKYIFSASKDCSIVKWDFESGKKFNVIPGIIKKKNHQTQSGHSSCILALAISSDSKFLVSGCHDKIIHVWNPETMQFIHTFKGHRGPVSGLVFRKGTHQLFSSSFDRSVKVWNLDEMTYVETLFGHQDIITAIDCFIKERAITSGGRDSSVRIWKIVEESQLVFQGNNSSIDCVKLIDEQHFVSASDNGSISLWGSLKKKPLVIVPNAHGMGQSEANWIDSIAVVKNTDLIASGSQNGEIKLWKCTDDCKKLEFLFSIPIKGFINCMEFTNDGLHLVAAVGQEHRFGRWWRIKQAKNSVVIIPLKQI